MTRRPAISLGKRRNAGCRRLRSLRGERLEERRVLAAYAPDIVGGQQTYRVDLDLNSGFDAISTFSAKSIR